MVEGSGKSLNLNSDKIVKSIDWFYASYLTIRMLRNHHKDMLPDLSLKLPKDISFGFEDKKRYLVTPRMKKILKREGM